MMALHHIRARERLEYGLALVLAVRRAHQSHLSAEMTLAISNWKSTYTRGGLSRWNVDPTGSKWKLVEPCACLSLIAYRYNRPGD